MINYPSQAEIELRQRVPGSLESMAALEPERADNREAVAEHHSNVANVRDISNEVDPVEHVFRLLLKLNEDQKVELTSRLEELIR
jgi:hypothetical protein